MKRKIFITCLLCLIAISVVMLLLFLLIEEPDKQENATDKLQEVSLESESMQKTPADCDPLSVWSFAEEFLKENNNFSSKTTGYIDIQVSFFNYRQTISNRRVITPTPSFYEWTNSGFLLNSGLQVYTQEDQTLLQIGNFWEYGDAFWSDSIYAVSNETYLASMGAYYNTLSLYVLKEDTVESSAFVSGSGTTYTFSYQVSKEAFDTYAYVLQTLYGLEKAPQFKSSEIILEVDKNFRPISVSYEENYSIPVDPIGDTLCVASYEEVFSYDDFDISEEQAFFETSAIQKEGSFPKMPAGFNLLFSLFGNNRSYDLVVSYEDNSSPFRIDFDATNARAYLHNDRFSFLYTDTKYYISYQDYRVSFDKNMFNKQTSTRASEAIEASNEDNVSPDRSNLDDFSVTMENGCIILSSSSEERMIRAVIDINTMTIQRAEIDLFYGDNCTSLDLTISETRGTIPDVSSYQDISSPFFILSLINDLSEYMQQLSLYPNIGENGFWK